MTPLRFEELHAPEWTELATLLDLTHQRRRQSVSLMQEQALSPERIAALYRGRASIWPWRANGPIPPTW